MQIWFSSCLLLAVPWVEAQSIRCDIALCGTNTVALSWNGAQGKHYTVEAANDVSDGWQNAYSPPETFTCSTNDLTCSLPVGLAKRFFRIAEVGTNDVPPGMALVPAGSFQMGDTFGEGDTNELPVHAVYVSSFFMDHDKVTRALWNSVCEWAANHGYSFDLPGLGKADDHPVYSVTWYDAVKWCNARSELQGRLPAYYTDGSRTTVYRTGQVVLQENFVNWNAGFRLPTEAEWEKAARGSLSGKRFPWGDLITHADANYLSITNWAYDVSATRGFHPSFYFGDEPYTSPAGSFAPNGYGLRDLAGNLREWCWDWSDAYSAAPQVNPRGPASGIYRVRRCGSWTHYAVTSRCADRGGYGPANTNSRTGFRCVLPSNQP